MASRGLGQAREIEHTLADIRRSLPTDVVIATEIFKQADGIDAAIDNVKEAIRDGVIWVVVVLSVFLWSFRTSLVTLAAIPLSMVTTALALAMFAYVYARKFARDERFALGTGKVNPLAGYTGAVLLAMFVLLMTWESIGRLVEPVPIAFNQALLVAVFGLLVNGRGPLREPGRRSC